jgi:integrase
MSERAKQFTDRTIKALKPQGRRYERMDSGPGSIAGLGIRVDEQGQRVFVLIKRFPGSSNPARRRLGNYPAMSLVEARAKAAEWLKLIERGIDPRIEDERKRLAEQRRVAETFSAASEKFFASRHLKAQRAGHVVERIIRNELLPHWSSRPVTDLTHRDVRELIERVVDRGAETYAGNVLDAVHAVLNFAVAHDMIEINPARLLKRNVLIGPRRHRTRVLNDLELRALWRASGRLRYPYDALYRLLTLTGCRLDEVAGARWSEFDLNGKRWTIPAARFKSDAEHIVPLSNEAVAVLRGIRRFQRGDHLFSCRYGERPVNYFSRTKTQLDRQMLRTLRALARLRGDDPRNVQLDAFVNHDIRRTVRTRLSALKIQDHVAELVIGHGRKGIARIYDQHRFEDEKREALDKWAALLRSIVEPPSASNVVALSA